MRRREQGCMSEKTNHVGTSELGERPSAGLKIQNAYKQKVRITSLFVQLIDLRIYFTRGTG